MANRNTEIGDVISELPDSLLHHILSFMQFSQIAQTSLLSKRWEKIWLTYPVLEFEDKYLENRNVDFVRRRNERFKRMVETLRRRRNDIVDLMMLNLRMSLIDDEEFTSLFYQCVSHAIGCNVKELQLEMQSVRYDFPYCILPEIIMFAKSLEVLRLEGFSIETGRTDLNLSSLTKLTLSEVQIDEQSFKNVLNGCSSSIEYLNLLFCRGCETIELVGLPKFCEFYFVGNCDLKRVDIRLPNILSVQVHQKFCEINLILCVNLRSLNLSELSILDEELHDLISKLPALKLLCISECNMLRAVKISSSSIEGLKLHICDEWTDLMIDTPNLRHLTIWGAITSLSFSKTSLSKIKIKNFGWDVFTQKRIEFLTKLGHLRVPNFRISATRYLTVPRELRRTLSSPLSNLEWLDFQIIATEKCASIAKLVDCLLWIAPHTETISIRIVPVSSKRNIELHFKFTYKKKTIGKGEKKGSCCCKFEPITCWYECMERVDVAFKEGSKVIKCALEGEYIWERKIDAVTNDWMRSAFD